MVNIIRNMDYAEINDVDKSDVSLRIKALNVTLYIIIKIVNVFYIPLLVYRPFQKPKKCPPVNDDVLKFPGYVLTEKIRKQEISCESVIKAYISRIKEVNPIINAVIEERFTEAIEEAKRVDQLIKCGEIEENYPLLGVPLTVKGSIAVTGLKNTSGMVTRKEISKRDAVTVEQARKAGAIPLLTSNVPELCMNWETTNKLVGTTKNPHKTTRTCGGSSGGEASLIASGASLIGIGSDIAGSLRLPAHYCGVCGHKPTPGVVSYEGHYPSCSNHEQWVSSFTLGPMARHVKDLRILLDVISTPETKDVLGLHDMVDLEKISIYYLNDLNALCCDRVNQHCTEAVEKVIKHFRYSVGSEVKKLDIPLMKHAPTLAAIHLVNIDDVDNPFGGKGEGAWAELFRYVTFRSKHTIMAIIYGLLRGLHSHFSEGIIREVEENLERIKGCFQATLGRSGVLVMPTFPTEAPYHGDSIRKCLNSTYLSIFNALGFPVTNCPVSVTKNGLPVGVQLVALPYCDKLTLAVAEEIENAFGGWICP